MGIKWDSVLDSPETIDVGGRDFPVFCWSTLGLPVLKKEDFDKAMELEPRAMILVLPDVDIEFGVLR